MSKSLDVLIEARVREGVIPHMSVCQAADLGLRQSPVLPLVHGDKEDGYELGGAALFNDRQMTGTLTAEEMQLLALMSGQKKKGTITLSGKPWEVQSFSCRLKVEQDHVSCVLRISGKAPSTSADRQAGAVADAVQELASRLRQAGCDAFGLARQTLLGAWSGEAWAQVGWPERIAALPWRVRVEQ